MRLHTHAPTCKSVNTYTHPCASTSTHDCTLHTHIDFKKNVDPGDMVMSHIQPSWRRPSTWEWVTTELHQWNIHSSKSDNPQKLHHLSAWRSFQAILPKSFPSPTTAHCFYMPLGAWRVHNYCKFLVSVTSLLNLSPPTRGEGFNTVVIVLQQMIASRLSWEKG